MFKVQSFNVQGSQCLNSVDRYNPSEPDAESAALSARAKTASKKSAGTDADHCQWFAVAHAGKDHINPEEFQDVLNSGEEFKVIAVPVDVERVATGNKMPVKFSE